jgi:DNA replication and repair protein RecF
MGFTSLRTVGFRNLKDAEVSLDASQVFLVGDNGQGKTNLLEALYVLCYGSSFRTRKDDQLVTHGLDDMRLHGRIRTGDAEERTMQVTIRNRKKTIELDGKAVRDRKDLIEVMPCIVFCHDDIQFVTGSPDMQRWFFDQTLSLHHPSYIDLLRRYRKVLKNRNLCLKNGDAAMVGVYDSQLAEAGLHLQVRREHAVREFNETFMRMFRDISGLPGDLCISYRPSWKEIQDPMDAVSILERRRDTDMSLGTTTSGPHRDRFRYRYKPEGVHKKDEREFSETASTGQIRLVSLILRAAQAMFFAEKTGKKPVLLLDDVLLELDPQRRKKFLSGMPEHKQAIFTFLPDEQYYSFRTRGTMVYRVERGVFTLEKSWENPG